MNPSNLFSQFKLPELPRPNEPLPWAFLDTYRDAKDGAGFSGQWPSLPELFTISAARFSDRHCFTAFEPDRISLSYSEALERVRCLADHLKSLGVAKGDRVALCGKNGPEWAVSYLAILFADAVVVPLDQSLRDEDVVTFITASGAEVFIADADKLASISVPVKERLCLENGGPSYVYSAKGDASKAKSTVRGADLAAILYTSGTTGNPKGVMLSHENLTSDCLLAQYYMTILPDDVFYALLPIHHSYTMLAVFIEALSVGAEIVFGKRLVTSQILKDLKQARVTMFLGVPLLFNKLLAGIMKGIREKGPIVYGLIRALMALSGFIKKSTGANPGKKLFHTVLSKASLDSIRICISGGGPLAPETFRKFNQLGIDFVQGYGLTETSPIITLNPIWRYKEQSVGAVLPGVEMRIDQPAPDGRGEIVVKGPMVMRGYFRNDSETAKTFTADGWLKTGDVGWLDEEQYLYLTGRAKNMIVTEGGKNVFPEEIENAFQLYLEIDQILVRGYLADERMRAEGIEAVIYPAEDSFKGVEKSQIEARINAIVTEVNQKLHSYEKIGRVVVVDQPMEMTSTKKIKRFAV